MKTLTMIVGLLVYTSITFGQEGQELQTETKAQIPIQGNYEYAVIRSHFPNRQHGGSSIIQTWQTRLINTLESAGNTPGWIELSDNTIKLLPGVYKVSVTTVSYGNGYSRLRLYDFESESTILYGMNGYIVNTAAPQLSLSGIFELTNLARIQLQQISGVKFDNYAFGLESGSVFPNETFPEIYTLIEIIRFKKP